MAEKYSTGPNARPKNATIAQSGEGIPDDSSRVPPEVREADEAAARRSLDALGEKEEPAQSKQGGQPGSKPGSEHS